MEDSLAENIQGTDLHPLDHYRAFQTLHEQRLGDGPTEDDVPALPAFLTDEAAQPIESASQEHLETAEWALPPTNQGRPHAGLSFSDYSPTSPGHCAGLLHFRSREMPDYTIEMTYHLPISRKRTYSADTAETAYHAAIKDDDWDGARNDYETPGELMSPVSGKERMPPIAVRRFPPLHSFAK